MIYDHQSGTLSQLDMRIVEAVPPGGNWRDIPDDIPSRRLDQIRTSAARGAGSRSTYYGRLRWDRPSYTISTYFTRPGNGAFIHPERDRLITVREAARLQSFPDNVRFLGPMRSRAMQVGNAVPPLLAFALGSVHEPSRVVDLFAGAGGLSLGLSWAGHEILAAADQDVYALGVTRQSHDLALALPTDMSDSTEVQSLIRAVRHSAGREGVGLVVGGPPCQGFSTAGSNVANDPRNKLVHAFIQTAIELAPPRVILENVPALAQSRGKVVLASIRRELDNAGYDTEFRILHAEGYGVPQLRRRFFLQAVRRGMSITWPAPTQAISIPRFLALQPSPEASDRLDPSTTVRDAISDLSDVDEHSSDAGVEYPTPTASRFQAWARGEVPVGRFIDGRASITRLQLGLGMNQ